MLFFRPKPVLIEKASLIHFNKDSIGIVHPVTYSGTTIPKIGADFYIWYMDKNRPLPRGELFNSYREKDFKCRQAEGFPSPKYESLRTITDDRCSYIYVTEELCKKAALFKTNIANYYDNVIHYMEKHQPECTSSKESLPLLVYSFRFSSL